MSEKNFVGYEYTNVTVKRSVANLYEDSYENFGYELESKSDIVGKIDSVLMRFKRDRKIRNKSELTRLQRNFDSCVNEVIELEKSKYIMASIVAYIIGIIGTAFMAGSVFFVTADMVVPCIILAVPAFIGWVLPYFLYKNIVKKKTAELTPLIDEKYDEIYDICEKAHSLREV